MLPARRVRRAPPLPNSVRISAARRTSDTGKLLIVRISRVRGDQRDLTYAFVPAVLRIRRPGGPDVGAGKHRVECGGRWPPSPRQPANPTRQARRVVTGSRFLDAAGQAERPTSIADVLVPTAAPAVSVPAKLNVGLAVGPRRPDGFHPIDTIFCALDLRDEVSAEPAEALSLSVT